MFFIELWRKMKGEYFCISTKSSSGTWKDHYFARGELSSVRGFIKDNLDKDLYFCPHGLKKKSRKEESAVLPALLWSDLDEANPRGIDVEPTIALESSPGRYVGFWVIDKPMNKELNRALTYHVGADKSGWDIGQVLRIPGTYNYKYPTHPKVRMLWDDGRDWRVDELSRIVKVRDKKSSSSNELSASEVFAEYQTKLPRWLRSELLRRDPPKAGKRSEMIWKLEHALLECGLDQDESFVLIKASVWNKFRGRHNEDEQLRHELDKIVKDRLDATAPERIVSSSNDYVFCAHPMSEVESRNIDWVWYGRLARGEITIVEGDPGLGKSYFVQMVCKHVCDADRLPGMRDTDPMHPHNIIYFDFENDPGSVTKNRLMDNRLKDGDRFFQEEMPFSIDDEDALEGAEKAIERLKPAIVVFDVVGNYIGAGDTHKASDVQQKMIWFREIARRFDCAVVVLRHLTKGGKEKALYRGQGSIAFAGTARVVITIGQHPEDADMRVAAVTKTNLGVFPRAVSFSISPLPDTLKRRDRSRFEWGDLVDYTSDDIVNAPQGDRGKDKGEAESFLRDVLGDGDVELKRIETMAEKRSIGKRLLQRVADAMGVVRDKRGFGKEATTWWSLPDEQP